MKIKVSSVPAEGMDCTETYTPQRMELETAEFKLIRPLEADYHIKREENELRVEVSVRAFLETSCARCLENLEYPLKKEYSFSYKVKETDIIDPTDDIRQEIIIDWPMKPVCKPDCLGLCPRCGENLNKGKCSCQMKT